MQAIKNVCETNSLWDVTDMYRRFRDICCFQRHSTRMLTGAAGSSDTLILTVRTSIREEADVYVVFSDNILHSYVKAKNLMRGQARLRNAVSFCVTMHAFRTFLTTYIFRMLFQAPYNSTLLFANLSLSGTHSCVGQDHKIDCLSIREYIGHLSGT